MTAAVPGSLHSPKRNKYFYGKLLDVAPGTATMEIVADTDKHANPMGTIHGGVFCDIADAVMGLAYRSTLAESESLTTIELKINFLRPVKFLT